MEQVLGVQHRLTITRFTSFSSGVYRFPGIRRAMRKLKAIKMPTRHIGIADIGQIENLIKPG